MRFSPTLFGWPVLTRNHLCIPHGLITGGFCAQNTSRAAQLPRQQEQIQGVTWVSEQIQGVTWCYPETLTLGWFTNQQTTALAGGLSHVGFVQFEDFRGPSHRWENLGQLWLTQQGVPRDFPTISRIHDHTCMYSVLVVPISWLSLCQAAVGESIFYPS